MARLKTSCNLYLKPKEQAFDVSKTNKPGGTWKVFAMVRLLMFEFTGLRSFSRRSGGMMGWASGTHMFGERRLPVHVRCAIKLAGEMAYKFLHVLD
jgi:hypothetical protein